MTNELKRRAELSCAGQWTHTTQLGLNFIQYTLIANRLLWEHSAWQRSWWGTQEEEGQGCCVKKTLDNAGKYNNFNNLSRYLGTCMLLWNSLTSLYASTLMSKVLTPETAGKLASYMTL